MEMEKFRFEEIILEFCEKHGFKHDVMFWYSTQTREMSLIGYLKKGTEMIALPSPPIDGAVVWEGIEMSLDEFENVLYMKVL